MKACNSRPQRLNLPTLIDLSRLLKYRHCLCLIVERSGGAGAGLPCAVGQAAKQERKRPFSGP